MGLPGPLPLSPAWHSTVHVQHVSHTLSGFTSDFSPYRGGGGRGLGNGGRDHPVRVLGGPPREGMAEGGRTKT